MLNDGNQSAYPDQPKFDWDFSRGGFGVPLDGTLTVGVLDGSRPAGSTVEVLPGYVDANGDFIPYTSATEKAGVNVTYDNNGVPTSVTFDGATIKANNPLAQNNDYFHVAVVVTESSGTRYCSSGCDVGLNRIINAGQGAPSNGPHFDWDFSNGRFRVPVNGTFTIDILNGGNVPAGTTVDVQLGEVASNGDFIPYATADQIGITVICDSNNNNVPVSVIFDGALIYANNPLVQKTGDTFHVAIVGVDSNGTHLIQGCDVHLDGVSCNHNNTFKWWDTNEEDHQLHCGNCGDPVGPIATHTDDVTNSDGSTGADGLCDDCDVLVQLDNGKLVHKHVKTTQWFANNDNTEHFHNCTDNNCTKSFDPHTAVDNDNDGDCDVCNCVHSPELDNQGNPMFGNDSQQHFYVCTHCSQPYDFEGHDDSRDNDGLCDKCGYGQQKPGQCTHTDDDFWIKIEKETHQAVCNHCGYDRGPADDHVDNNTDALCDDCGAKVVIDSTSGKLVHNHNVMPRPATNNWFANYDNHFNKCDNCGMTSFNFNNHVDLKDANGNAGADGYCDECKVSVDQNFKHDCPPSAMTYISDGEETHKQICKECETTHSDSRHVNNSGNDNLCDDCGITVNADDVHEHTPDGNWKEDTFRGEHCCECADAKCNDWVYAGHEDGDDSDDLCDDCGADYKCKHSNNNFWWSTMQDSHQLNCNDCGEYVAEEAYHTDTNADDKCDDCGVEVLVYTDDEGNEYILHQHVWETTLSMANDHHHYNCSDTACSVDTDPVAHFDNVDNGNPSLAQPDGACDACGATNVQDWCQGHVNSGAFHIDSTGEYHYTMCDNCCNAYGDPVAHTPSGEFNTDEESHYAICSVCTAEMKAESHSGTQYVAVEDQHYLECAICGETYGEAYDHTDDDMDETCDVCGETVEHELSGARVEFQDGHANVCVCCDKPVPSSKESHNWNPDPMCKSEDAHSYYCGDCDTFIGQETAHFNTDGDDLCDECHVRVDENNKHSHEYRWIVDEYYHEYRCFDCGLCDISEMHIPSNGACTICKATVNADGEHTHDYKFVYLDNDGHIDRCTDVNCNMENDYLDHTGGDDGICDDCGEEYIAFTTAFTDAAGFESKFIAAFNKAVNDNDFTELEKYYDPISAYDFVYMYKDILSQGLSVTLKTSIVTYTSTTKDIVPGGEAEDLFNSAKDAVGNYTLSHIYANVFYGGLKEGNASNSWQMSGYNGAVKVTAEFNPVDVKANRVWHLYTFSEVTGEWTKVASSAEGASSLTYNTTEDEYVYAVAYEDVVQPTVTPTPTPAPVVTPEATVAPTATPAPTVAPTATPAVSPSPTVAPTASPTPALYSYKNGTKADVYEKNSTQLKSDVVKNHKITDASVTVTKYYDGWGPGRTNYYTKKGEMIKGQVKIGGEVYDFDSEGHIIRDVAKGIDVSKYQPNINWKKVKASGVDFVIIRAGYRGYGSGVLVEDPYFKSHIEGAINAGLKVGVYFYSQAISTEEAVEEASMVLQLVKKYKLTYPVYFDTEATGTGVGRADNLSQSHRTKIANAFCKTIKNSGYKAGIYASKSWFYYQLDYSQLSQYDIWLAHYTTSTDFKYHYDMWQYTGTGSCEGVSNAVDLNWAYKVY